MIKNDSSVQHEEQPEIGFVSRIDAEFAGKGKDHFVTAETNPDLIRDFIETVISP